MVHVTSVSPAGNFMLRVRFSDGSAGEVDMRNDLNGVVFEPLRDPKRFAEAFVDDELGTVAWPNGADVAPEYLYEAVRRQRGVAERG